MTLNTVEEIRGPNYQALQGDITVLKDDQRLTTMYPEKRFYPVANMPTTEAAIDYRVTRDLYIVLGDRQEDGGWTVRSYIKPLANWIWIGTLMMAFGGLLSLSDRRLRIGVEGHVAALRPRYDAYSYSYHPNDCRDCKFGC